MLHVVTHISKKDLTRIIAFGFVECKKIFTSYKIPMSLITNAKLALGFLYKVFKIIFKTRMISKIKIETYCKLSAYNKCLVRCKFF